MILLGIVKKKSSYELVSDSEWLPRQCYLTLRMQKHCKW